MAENNISAMRFIVQGRVQGVGYRAATQRQAAALGLCGWVCNRSDGQVEGIAAGAAEPLRQLQEWLHQGPTLARVTAVQWLPCEPPAAVDFGIRTNDFRG